MPLAAQLVALHVMMASLLLKVQDTVVQVAAGAHKDKNVHHSQILSVPTVLLATTVNPNKLLANAKFSKVMEVPQGQMQSVLQGKAEPPHHRGFFPHPGSIHSLVNPAKMTGQ
jgi:hypothetical protein